MCVSNFIIASFRAHTDKLSQNAGVRWGGVGWGGGQSPQGSRDLVVSFPQGDSSKFFKKIKDTPPPGCTDK